MNARLVRWSLAFLRWFCNPEFVEDIEGDLVERYERKYIHQKLNKWLLIRDVLMLFRPGIIRPLFNFQKLNNNGMIHNYYKVSTRNILRNKTFSFLNISGLSIGIASCLLILIYINNELSYDTYNTKYDRIYRVLHDFNADENSSNEPKATSEYQVWGNAPIAGALKDFYPQIEDVFRFTSDFDWLFEYKEKRFQETGIAFADSTFYQIFDWDWLGGDQKTALTRPGTIILSKQLAEKYFGDENPIGKSLKMDGSDLYEVTGVYNIPPNSHFSYPGFMSMASFIKMRPGIFEQYGYVDFYTYFTINEHVSIESMSADIPKLHERYTSDKDWYSIKFEPLSDAYLNSEARRQPGPIGNSNNIELFIAVAIFVLIIACINFMNLSTARSVERAKEVAIRKTIGSQRNHLIFQFLFESTLLTIVASLIALLLVFFGHQYLEMLIGKSLPIEWLFSFKNILIGVGAVALLGILTGTYPAFVLSKFKPVKVLKGAFKNSAEGIWLRKLLVILQISFSIFLLVGTVIVYLQLNYLKQYDKGYENEQVLVINFGWDSKVQRSLSYIKSEFLKHPAVNAIAASRATPGDFFPNAGTNIASPQGEMINHSPAIYEIDEDFIPTYGMEMVAGRNYSKAFPADSTTSMILNESAAKLFGYPNPEEIIGKKFTQWGREGSVVGVVKDFNYTSLHNRVEPLTLRYSTPVNTSMLSLKLQTNNYAQTISDIEEQWNEMVPHYPFVAHFSDSNFAKQYETDARFGNVYSIFSCLAIFVSCLGLLGLTIYSTAQRAKEIGMRKVLGAPIRSIVAILTMDFVKLFIVALVISAPLAYWIMQKWLENFAYQVEVGWEAFGLAAAFTLLISLFTMSFRIISSAMANPVTVLKNE